MEHQPILTIEASYRTDISAIAHSLELECHADLKPAPTGIYCCGKLEPVMINDRNYYTNPTGKGSVLVKDINTVDTAIYDEAGKCVIPLYYMKKRSAMVANTPFMPYRGLHVLKELVTSQIDQTRAYRKYTKNKYDSLNKHFVPGTDVNETYGELLDNIYDSLDKEISDFLGNHSWNMYFVKLQNTIMVLERGMDYRAYLWEQEHGEAWRAGRYNPA